MNIVSFEQGESFLRQMVMNVRDALDSLPEQLRLAVWFGACLRFTPLETAEMMSVPVNSVGNLGARGLRRIADRLDSRQIRTDEQSIRIMLDVLAREPAPERLMQRIDGIVMKRCAFIDKRTFGRSVVKRRMFGRRRRDQLQTDE